MMQESKRMDAGEVEFANAAVGDPLLWRRPWSFMSAAPQQGLRDIAGEHREADIQSVVPGNPPQPVG